MTRPTRWPPFDGEGRASGVQVSRAGNQVLPAGAARTLQPAFSPGPDPLAAGASNDLSLSQRCLMADEHWTWQTDRSIPSEAGAGRSIQEALLRQMQAAGWSRHDRFSVRLAMEEAIVNAIAHGNCYDTAKRVRVRCWLGPELVRVEICDEGAGFDPAAVPDPTDPERLQCPRGRGLMLMRHFMTAVRYTPSGNTVVLEKRRADDADP